MVSKLLEKVEEKLDTSVKVSLGDYIRLVQLRKELEEDDVREIKVTWVDPEGPVETAEAGPNIEEPAKKSRRPSRVSTK